MEQVFTQKEKEFAADVQAREQTISQMEAQHEERLKSQEKEFEEQMNRIEESNKEQIDMLSSELQVKQ